MLTIRGYSDDIIEFEGDVREEAYAKEEGNYIALSNGSVFKIVYSDSGVWRITPASSTNVFAYDIYQAPEDDDSDYSDVLTVHDHIKWVVVGTDYLK